MCVAHPTAVDVLLEYGALSEAAQEARTEHLEADMKDVTLALADAAASGPSGLARDPLLRRVLSLALQRTVRPVGLAHAAQRCTCSASALQPAEPGAASRP